MSDLSLFLRSSVQTVKAEDLAARDRHAEKLRLQEQSVRDQEEVRRKTDEALLKQRLEDEVKIEALRKEAELARVKAEEEARAARESLDWDEAGFAIELGVGERLDEIDCSTLDVHRNSGQRRIGPAARAAWPRPPRTRSASWPRSSA